MRLSLSLVVAACALVAGAAPRVASADGPGRGFAGAPRQAGHVYSAYEKATLARALAKYHAEVEPSPEGKTIEAIDIERLEVIEDRDLLPELVNVLHATTRESVVAREILLAPGDPWLQALVDETARNLHAVPNTVSLVVCEATKGSRPDRVRLLVITKDVWSLRGAWNIGIGSGGLESLVVHPEETNLAGTHQTVGIDFVYRPLSFALGAGYVNPRLAGRRLVLTAGADVITNRTTGKAEGTVGSASVYRPLYSARASWGHGLTTAWEDEVFRRYTNAKLALFTPAPTPSNPTPTAIPDQYRGRSFRETGAVTRSFGWSTKDDVSVGAEVSKRTFRVEDASGFDPATLARYERRRLPTSDTRVGPFVEWRHYLSDYAYVFDNESFALQEAYRLGPDLWLRLYPVIEPLGSSRSFFGTYAAAQYTAKLGGGIVRGYVESTTEAETSRLADAALAVGGHLATPTLGKMGRLVVDVGAASRYRNYMNRLEALGGATRLRGYPSSFVVGKDVVAANAEFRTRPVEILSCELGLVAFYDGGDAFDSSAAPGDTDHFRWLQSVGGGLRGLVPWLDRAVFRADVGVPLVRTAGTSPLGFYMTFQQAFPLASVGNASAQGEPTGVGALNQ